MTERNAMKQLGDRGEAVAASFLEEQGYTILERNYRFEQAEVDLICFQPAEEAERGGELVFVEVKTRSGLAFGRPEDAVDEQKRKHMIRVAEAFLHERRLDGAPCRFDVISVLLNRGAERVEHFKDAFWIF